MNNNFEQEISSGWVAFFIIAAVFLALMITAVVRLEQTYQATKACLSM